MDEFFAIFLYFFLLTAYALFKKKKTLTQAEFVIGNRSLNRWTTALAAHASDMSNWLFMAYPGMVFIRGGEHIWVAIGLLFMMWVNWVVIAPRIRKETEETKSVTITGFFEQKLGRQWPTGRLVTSLFLFIFYTIYVAVTLYGMGLLIATLFPVSYSVGVLLGICLIMPYILIGGYLTLAQMDLFQGLFLMAVLIFVPLYVIGQLGGFSTFVIAIHEQGRSFSLFSTPSALWKDLLLMLSWGLGYFGQPHILTKFMGIKNPAHLKGARRIGMTWQFLSLAAATLVGFVGVAAFKGQLADPEQVFIKLVKMYFTPFISGIFLCAIVAAIINSISSMLLVLSTTITEDFYKRFVRKNCSEKEQLLVTRCASALSALLAISIALGKFTTMDQLVLYAWSGLGASFGPLMIAVLYFKRVTTKAAWLGIAVGGGTVFLWPLFHLSFPSLVVAFPLSLATIHLASRQQVVEEKIQ